MAENDLTGRAARPLTGGAPDAQKVGDGEVLPTEDRQRQRTFPAR